MCVSSVPKESKYQTLRPHAYAEACRAAAVERSACAYLYGPSVQALTFSWLLAELCGPLLASAASATLRTHTCGLHLLSVSWLCTCCDPKAWAANSAMLQAACFRWVCRTNVSLASRSDLDQARPADRFISIRGRHPRPNSCADLFISICGHNPRHNSWAEPEWLVASPSTWTAPASQACLLHPICEMSGFSLSCLLASFLGPSILTLIREGPITSYLIDLRFAGGVKTS